VIAEGTSAELKGRLGGARIEVVLADAEEARRAAHALSDAGDGQVTVEESTVRVPARDGSAALSDVVRRLDAAGATPRGLQVREPSLDDVFLALTGHTSEASEPEEARP
jgi:ABC-2 type transport system ATP-binding protein